MRGGRIVCDMDDPVKIGKSAGEKLEALIPPACFKGPGPGNRNVPPENWAMTIEQWREVLNACRSSPMWSDAVGAKGYADLYDLTSIFLKPWTRGTGSGVALHMNPVEPLGAELMLSHSWAEDVMECEEALACAPPPVTAQTRIWFCAFSVYQPGDEPGDVGPTLAEQLSLDPFGRVIQRMQAIEASSSLLHGMVVIHTSRAEVYDRLWCVYEIAMALRSKVSVGVACSQNYFEASQGRVLDVLKVETKHARCCVQEDKLMIHRKVKKLGGFKKLDAEIFQFRMKMLCGLAQQSGRIQALQQEFDAAERCLQHFKQKARAKVMARSMLPVVLALLVFAIVLVLCHFAATGLFDRGPQPISPTTEEPVPEDGTWTSSTAPPSTSSQLADNETDPCRSFHPGDRHVPSHCKIDDFPSERNGLGRWVEVVAIVTWSFVALLVASAVLRCTCRRRDTSELDDRVALARRIMSLAASSDNIEAAVL